MAKFGVNDARRIHCVKFPKTHGLHPEDERCGMCGTLEETAAKLAAKAAASVGRWYVHRVVGTIYDSRTWPWLSADADFRPLESICAYENLAEVMCGCDKGGQCTKYQSTGRVMTLCSWPQVYGEPGWSRA